MKKIIIFLTGFLLFSKFVFASTVYLPTASSLQYLPTVKILSYSLSYNGSVTAEAYGSGTLITDTGIILTNNHVIENYWDPSVANDAFQICLTKSNDPETPICEFTASLIARDADWDIALLKMDSKDVTGRSLSFDFYLPYSDGDDYGIGDELTVIGYPDTGGRTITYTSGLISGLLTEKSVTYIKTDADVSFGNSGGTALDGDGNFIGIPTYIVGSYSSEVLGYIFPVSEAYDWINQNKGGDVLKNEVADAALKSAMLDNINANKNGVYQNDYPPFKISVVDGWKFGNSLEGAFERGGYGSYSGSSDVIIYPLEMSDYSQLYVGVAVTDYAYDVVLSDIEALLDDYSNYGDYESESYYERADFNGYKTVKDFYSAYGVTTITYYIPYGDKVISVFYNYGDDEESRLSEVYEILSSFEVDMDEVVSGVFHVVESDDPKIKIKNPTETLYLSDGSYDYAGRHYFGATFGKKGDYNFYINVYSNDYVSDDYAGDFDKFKADTYAEVELWYDVLSKGDLKIDGHNGFFYTYDYEGYDGTYLYTIVYVEGDSDDVYFTIAYSGLKDSYAENLSDLKLILKNISLSNDGKGVYDVPDFSDFDVYVKRLGDIEYHVYESSIKNLNYEGAFGDNAPFKFDPEGFLSRGDFLFWAVLTLQGSAYEDFSDFESSYLGCGDSCFSDVDYTSDEGMYVDFAFKKGAIGGLNSNGKYYFDPDSQISLAAALKIIFELYDYDIWEAPSFIPWYLPYIQLGYQNGVMPYGVYSVDYMLKRGEGAYIIDSVMYGYESWY